MSSIHDIQVQSIDGESLKLERFAGKVLLVVNVASKCGLTPQYEGLERLYEDKRAEGLEVLAFPANDFKEQEPDSNEQIKSFCTTNYQVEFPLFAKISVVGDAQHPLYQALTDAQPEAVGEGPMRQRLEGYGIAANPAPQVLWNFEKFVVDRQGRVVARFAPDVAPDDARLLATLEAELAKR
ncbi:glutathione peroxidase [Pseudomonas lopnurensis]|uniref:glutathione peroxidase n=1 Tax=Pseudomonas lopnurensis TaxID=1477517 RepID=UPI0028A6FC80|nr:glutathione peroxidase [Pseudomonas lopnurensis]